ncbi:MAG: DNA translocase FtsK, partial [Acidobacteriota bacterium]
ATPPPANVEAPSTPPLSRSGRDLNELHRLVYGEQEVEEPLSEFSLSGPVAREAIEREMKRSSSSDTVKKIPATPSATPPQSNQAREQQSAPVRRRFDTPKSSQAAAAQVSATRNADPAINEMLESASIERVSQDTDDIPLPAAEPLLRFSNFALPDLKFLNPSQEKQEQADEELWERARLLAEKCKEFSVSGKIQHINPGPVVTTFEFKPDPGVKYSRVTSLVDDLCLALKAESIRIDRIPGKSTVGMEVPNVKREVIYLREIFESEKYKNSVSPLTLALGKTIDGKTYVADLARMPHLLIAGATGTGKSVCLNSIIVSILYKATPDDVKVIMVDPKRLELGLYEGIPHLLTPIVIDPKRASNALKWAVGEMENRYRMLAGYGVRNIDQYNQFVRQRFEQIPALHPDELPRPLPYILIIIDELADLMMVASSDVETSITRLAQMARAVGIHLVIATQRPSVDVITGLIKANFPSRISFRVSSKVDSRTILDTNGAETLLGQGDMLFLPPGTSRLVRVHGAYIGEIEINRIVEHIRKQAKPDYDERIQISDEEAEISNEGIGIRDELYDEAIRIICQMGRASTSVLQRRLRIGYGRAAAILDMMEKEGFVGPSDGSKPRVVKQDAYDYLERLDQVQE